MTTITFKVINHGTPEYRAAVALREDILRKPFGFTFLPEELEKEKGQIHIVGIKDTEVIATAVLAPEGKKCKMQRVVVKAGLQSSGIGTQMMVFCEEQAKAQGFTSIYCHARDSAVPFYLKNHYIPEGDYFDENTIPHLKMRKLLSLNITSSTQADVEIIDRKIDEFNKKYFAYKGDHYELPKNYIIKDGEEIIAGINSCLYLEEVLRVGALFVDERYRHKGIGSALLKQVEDEARAMGGKVARLDTLDFQALDFYLKCGYEVWGVLEDCPKGHKRYCLKKSL